MTRKELKKQAKASLSGNFGTVLGTILLAEIILSAASSMTFGIAMLFEGVLTFGLIGIQISVLRYGKAPFEQLFSGFSHFVSSFLAGLLKALYTTLWTLLFIVPGIVKSYSYAMTFYILNDNPDMDANEAITESRKMMKGHKGELFLLDLSFIGWLILCICTFGLLSFYVIPYMEMTRAAFYESIRPKRDPESDGENGKDDDSFISGGPEAPAPEAPAPDVMTEL